VLALAGLLVDDVGALAQRTQHVGQHLRIGTGGQSAFLGAAELGSRDHLHGLGDLPRALHAADTAPDIENVSHFRSPWVAALSAMPQLRLRCARPGSVPWLP